MTEPILSTAPAKSLRGPRVCLRRWVAADLEPFATMNADPEVMRFLSARLTRAESDAFVQRVRDHFEAHGYGLWALDLPQLGFAGFVGLAPVRIDLPVAGIALPPIEIGWRLARAAWGQGYATEAARLALRHGFEVLDLPQIVSFTSTSNRASQAVMQRIGLTLRGEFDHPRFEAGHALRRHVLYAMDAAAFALASSRAVEPGAPAT